MMVDLDYLIFFIKCTISIGDGVGRPDDAIRKYDRKQVTGKDKNFVERIFQLNIIITGLSFSLYNHFDDYD